MKKIIPFVLAAFTFFTVVAVYFYETDKLVSNASVYAAIGVIGFAIALFATNQEKPIQKNLALFCGMGIMVVSISIGFATSAQAFLENKKNASGLSYSQKCVSLAKAEKAYGYLLEIMPHRASAKCYLSSKQTGAPEKVFEIKNNVAFKTDFSYMKTPE